MFRARESQAKYTRNSHTFSKDVQEIIDASFNS